MSKLGEYGQACRYFTRALSLPTQEVHILMFNAYKKLVLCHLINKGTVVKVGWLFSYVFWSHSIHIFFIPCIVNQCSIFNLSL